VLDQVTIGTVSETSVSRQAALLVVLGNLMLAGLQLWGTDFTRCSSKSLLSVRRGELGPRVPSYLPSYTHFSLRLRTSTCLHAGAQCPTLCREHAPVNAALAVCVCSLHACLSARGRKQGFAKP